MGLTSPADAEDSLSSPVKGALCVLAMDLAQCGRTLSSNTLSLVRFPALGPVLTAADGCICSLLVCDIVALLL